MLTIVLAGLLAVLGAVAVLAYAHQANKRAIAGLHTQQVVVAAGLIRAGTSLGTAEQDNLLKTEELPTSSLSNNVGPLHSVAGKTRMVVNRNVQQSSILTSDMLQSAKTAGAVSAGFNVPKGMEAIAVALCIPESVASYVTAGSDVAVFDTYVTPINKSTTLQRTCNVSHQAVQSDTVQTRLVLQNLQVLSVGVSPLGGQRTPTIAGSVQATTQNSAESSQAAVLVTFAVPQADVWKLIQVAETGLPYLALNGPGAKTSFGTGAKTLFPTTP